MAKKLIITKDFDYDPFIPKQVRGLVTNGYYAKPEPQTLPEADANFALQRGYATEVSADEAKAPAAATAKATAAKATGESDGGGKA